MPFPNVVVVLAIAAMVVSVLFWCSLIVAVIQSIRRAPSVRQEHLALIARAVEQQQSHGDTSRRSA